MIEESKTNGNFYRFGNVTIDGENFRVTKSGKAVQLTPRAFDVLIYLLENRGRVIEKQELFEKIWKDNFVSDNSLTKIIKEIRQAIGDDASAPRFIETVPKRGYRFIADTSNDDENKGASQTLNTEKPQAEISPSPPRGKGRRFLLAAGAIVLGLVISAVGFIVLSEMRAEYIAANTPIDSLAVLPFETEAENPELENLSEQLTENLINSLSRLRNVRVLPRGTSFIYKNKGEAPYTIGRGLRVRSVLSGKIVRRGETLIVQVELTDVERKAQLWGQQYSRPVAESGKLHEEISSAVASHFEQSAPRR